MPGLYPGGFPHSDTPGSSPAHGSPRLFVVCHVLLRPLLPSHSPYALSSFTCDMKILKLSQHTQSMCLLKCFPPASFTAGHQCSRPRQHSCPSVTLWRCGDSNPGPPPCKGGALPPELHPLSVGLPGFEPGTSPLSEARSNQLSYKPPLTAEQ